MISRRIVAAAVALVVAWPVAASARDRVALYTFETFKLPSTIEFAALGMTKVVAERLRVTGYEVIEPVLGLRDMMVALDCASMDADCAIAMAKNLEVDAVVVGKLEAVKKGVRVRLRLWRVGTAVDVERDVNEVVKAEVSALTGAFSSLASKLVDGTTGDAASADKTTGSGDTGSGDTGSGGTGGSDSGTSGSTGEIVAPPMGVGADLSVAPVAPIAPKKLKPKAKRPLLVPGIVVAGLGVAALGVAAFTGVRTLALRKEVNDATFNTIEDFDAVASARSSGRIFSTMTLALMAGGVVAAGAGVALIALGGGNKDDSPKLSLLVGLAAPQVAVRLRFGGGAL